VNPTWSPRVLQTLLVVLVAALLFDLREGPLSFFAALGALLAVVVRVAVVAGEPVETDGETDGADAGDNDPTDGKA
jgi:hypothetical protein